MLGDLISLHWWFELWVSRLRGVGIAYNSVVI